MGLDGWVGMLSGLLGLQTGVRQTCTTRLTHRRDSRLLTIGAKSQRKYIIITCSVDLPGFKQVPQLCLDISRNTLNIYIEILCRNSLQFLLRQVSINFFINFSQQVASIYRDASINNYINIVVVKIAVFRSEQVRVTPVDSQWMEGWPNT